jgi:hypothetical protein
LTGSSDCTDKAMEAKVDAETIDPIGWCGS